MAGKPDVIDEKCEYRTKKTYLLSANNQDAFTLMKGFSKNNFKPLSNYL